MQLPEGWHSNILGEVCTLINRGIAPKYLDNDGTIVLNQKCIRDHRINYNLARQHNHLEKKIPTDRFIQVGDGLINSTGTGTLGRVAQVRVPPPEPTTVDTHVTIVRPKAGIFFQDFFGYMLINIESELTKSGEGASGQTELSRHKIANDFLVSYPNSQSEQKRIVAILDEAFAGINQAIANTEKNLANARELFDRVLTKKLDEFANLPATQNLTDLTELIVDCEHKTAPTQLTGYPSIRTPNIGKGDLLLDGVYRVSQDTYETWTKRAIPQTNDLILAREAPAGNIAVIPEGQKVCLGQRTVLIRPKLDKVQSYFLAYLILHPTLQQRLLSSSTGATVQHVNVKDIRNLGIGKLPNSSTQSILVSDIKIAKVESGSLENIYQQKLQALAELKQSLLQKAFSGELTANNVDKLVNP